MTRWLGVLIGAVALVAAGLPRNAAADDVPVALEEGAMAERPVDAAAIVFRPGEGVLFRSQDGAFALRIGIRMQLRATLRLIPTPEPDGYDAFSELTVRRARVELNGHLFGPDNTFKIQLSFSPLDNGLEDSAYLATAPFTPMRDYYLTFRQLRDLNVRVGQFKVPYSRERVTSSGDLQFADRSIANGEFNLDRSVGLSIRSDDLFGLGLLRYQAGVFSVRGRGAVGYDPVTLLYVARIEVLPLGLFDTLTDGDLERRRAPKLNFGVAAAFEDEAPGLRGAQGPWPSDGGTTDITNVTADAVLFWRGLSLVSDWHVRQSLRSGGDLGPVQAPRDGWGGRAQVGYVFPPIPLELAARYSYVRGTRARATSLKDANTVGGVLGWYVAQHALKVQVDYGHGFGEGSDRPTHEVRAQLQARL